MAFKITMKCKFPGSQVVRIQSFHCPGPGSISGQGTEIPQAVQHSKLKTKQNNETLQHKVWTLIQSMGYSSE